MLVQLICSYKFNLFVAHCIGTLFLPLLIHIFKSSLLINPITNKHCYRYSKRFVFSHNIFILARRWQNFNWTTVTKVHWSVGFPVCIIHLYSKTVFHTAVDDAITISCTLAFREFQLFTLWSWLPVRITMYQPVLLYTTEEHGCSLTTFYVRVEHHEPTLLMIKTCNNEVFLHFLIAKLNYLLPLKYAGRNTV